MSTPSMTPERATQVLQEVIAGLQKASKHMTPESREQYGHRIVDIDATIDLIWTQQDQLNTANAQLRICQGASDRYREQVEQLREELRATGVNDVSPERAPEGS